MKTHQRLITAAASLLDSGGESAVTLRAVAAAVGVSHNAPYKHFKDRSSLLAAVAIEDFVMLTNSFREIGLVRQSSLSKLMKALKAFATYGRDYPARYRLLFSDPDIAAQGGELEAAALGTFAEFERLVQQCQGAKLLPDIPNPELTGLIFASVHGLIDLKAGGRMRKEKGSSSVDESVALLIELLSKATNKA